MTLKRLAKLIKKFIKVRRILRESKSLNRYELVPPFLWKTEVSTALGGMKKMWFPGEEERGRNVETGTQELG